MISFDVVTLENARKCSPCEAVFAGRKPGRSGNIDLPPATMTHASVPAEVRARIGITDGLIPHLRRNRGRGRFDRRPGSGTV